MKRLSVSVLLLVCLLTVGLAQRTADRPLRSSSRGRSTGRKIIQLAEPNKTGQMSVEEALQKRRSVRLFTGQPLEFSELGQLAWAGQGVTDRQRGWRTATSAGALYPLNVYFCTPEGLFLYKPQDHSMEQLATEDVRPQLFEASGGQQAIATSGCTIILGGSSRKLAARFRDDARRYMLLEGGHVAQNIQLQAVAMGLGSVTIGGFNSRQASRAARLPKGYEVIYLIPVGHPQTAAPAASTAAGRASSPAVSQSNRPRALFIIPPQGFQDDELFQPKRALELSGVETVIAGRTRGVVRGMLGNRAEAVLALNEVQVDPFDAVVFVGGTGTQAYFEDPLVQSIARQAVSSGKIVGATSMAPTILANAGVLTGVRVTGFVSEKEKLQQAGAVYMGFPVERDRNIITASGPMAAPAFARALVTAIAERQSPAAAPNS